MAYVLQPGGAGLGGGDDKDVGGTRLEGKAGESPLLRFEFGETGLHPHDGRVLVGVGDGFVRHGCGVVVWYGWVGVEWREGESGSRGRAPLGVV